MCLGYTESDLVYKVQNYGIIKDICEIHEPEVLCSYWFPLVSS